MKLAVSHDTFERKVRMFIDCPLCEFNDMWPEPAIRHNPRGWHDRLGMHWKPEKGHKDYEWNQASLKKLSTPLRIV